jgi:hypothetical protein
VLCSYTNSWVSIRNCYTEFESKRINADKHCGCGIIVLCWLDRKCNDLKLYLFEDDDFITILFFNQT